MDELISRNKNVRICLRRYTLYEYYPLTYLTHKAVIHMKKLKICLYNSPGNFSPTIVLESIYLSIMIFVIFAVTCAYFLATPERQNIRTVINRWIDGWIISNPIINSNPAQGEEPN